MTTASIDLQGTAHPIIDTDPHPAASPLQDARTYLLNLTRYARDLYTWAVECADLNRADQAVFLGTTGVVLTGLVVAVI